jgi:hypothetical protein
MLCAKTAGALAQDGPYRISSLTLTAESWLEPHKCSAVNLFQGALTVLAIALRLAVAGTLLSLSSAAFWVLLLELQR